MGEDILLCSRTRPQAASIREAIDNSAPAWRLPAGSVHLFFSHLDHLCHWPATPL
jgi:hypothetical protein